MTSGTEEIYCKKCSKLYWWSPYTGTASPERCKCPEEITFKQEQIGTWICPNCGAGMSPTAQRCGCVDYVSYYTSTTSQTEMNFNKDINESKDNS